MSDNAILASQKRQVFVHLTFNSAGSGSAAAVESAAVNANGGGGSVVSPRAGRAKASSEPAAPVTSLNSLPPRPPAARRENFRQGEDQFPGVGPDGAEARDAAEEGSDADREMARKSVRLTPRDRSLLLSYYKYMPFKLRGLVDWTVTADWTMFCVQSIFTGRR